MPSAVWLAVPPLAHEMFLCPRCILREILISLLFIWSLSLSVPINNEAHTKIFRRTAFNQKMSSAAELIASGRVVIFSWVTCPYCVKAKKLLQPLVPPEEYKVYDIDRMPNGDAIHAEIIKATNHETVPAVYINGQFVGGFSDCDALNRQGQLQKLIAGK